MVCKVPLFSFSVIQVIHCSRICMKHYIYSSGNADVNCGGFTRISSLHQILHSDWTVLNIGNSSEKSHFTNTWFELMVQYFLVYFISWNICSQLDFFFQYYQIKLTHCDIWKICNLILPVNWLNDIQLLNLIPQLRAFSHHIEYCSAMDNCFFYNCLKDTDNYFCLPVSTQQYTLSQMPLILVFSSHLNNKYLVHLSFCCSFSCFLQLDQWVQYLRITSIIFFLQIVSKINE